MYVKANPTKPARMLQSGVTHRPTDRLAAVEAEAEAVPGS